MIVEKRAQAIQRKVSLALVCDMKKGRVQLKVKVAQSMDVYGIHRNQGNEVMILQLDTLKYIILGDIQSHQIHPLPVYSATSVYNDIFTKFKVGYMKMTGEVNI